MPWARFDDGAYDHPKIVDAASRLDSPSSLNECFGAWSRMIIWSCKALTDGRVPRAQAAVIAGRSEVLTALKDAGLLRVEGTDYVLHDFEVYQPEAAAERVRRAEISEKRRAAGRLGAAATNGARGTRPADAAAIAAITAGNCSGKTAANDSATVGGKTAEMAALADGTVSDPANVGKTSAIAAANERQTSGPDTRSISREELNIHSAGARDAGARDLDMGVDDTAPTAPETPAASPPPLPLALADRSAVGQPGASGGEPRRLAAVPSEPPGPWWRISPARLMGTWNAAIAPGPMFGNQHAFTALAEALEAALRAREVPEDPYGYARDAIRAFVAVRESWTGNGQPPLTPQAMASEKWWSRTQQWIAGDRASAQPQVPPPGRGRNGAGFPHGPGPYVPRRKLQPGEGE